MQQYSELPTTLYTVRVPIMATYSEAEIEVYGLSVDVKDGEVVKDSFENMTTVMININRMVDIYLSGFPISIPVQKEANEIYKALENYLHGTNTSKDYSPNSLTVKDERLEEIDKFASEIFGLNRHSILKESVNVGTGGYNLGANLMSVARVSQQPTNNDQLSFASRTGVMADYDIHEEEDLGQVVPENANYINNQLPDIDFVKVKREPIYKDNGLLDGYNN